MSFFHERSALDRLTCLQHQFQCMFPLLGTQGLIEVM